MTPIDSTPPQENFIPQETFTQNTYLPVQKDSVQKDPELTVQVLTVQTFDPPPAPTIPTTPPASPPPSKEEEEVVIPPVPDKTFTALTCKPEEVFENGGGVLIQDQSQNLSSFNLDQDHNCFPNDSKTIGKQLVNDSNTTDKLLVNDSKTIGKQFEHNLETIGKQSGDVFPNDSKTIGKQLVNNSNTNLSPWDEDKYVHEYAKLVGFQKQVLLYIVKRCIANDSLVSGPIAKQDFKEHVSPNLDSIKTTIQRLVHKGFLQRELSKSGAGGFSVFSISQAFKKMILGCQNPNTIGKQLVNDSKTFHKQTLSSSSYNNIYINKTTTTNEDLCSNRLPIVSKTNPNQLFDNCLPIVSKTNQYPMFDKDLSMVLDGDEKCEFSTKRGELPNDGWASIDCESLEFIGFNKNHLVQLKKHSELSPEIVQDSIHAFAFDLKHNGLGDKIKTHPLNYFMGILRTNKPYAAPSNYQDPKLLAMQQYLDRKKQMREEIKKVEEELFQFNFEQWQETLTQEEVNQIIPEPRYREYPMKEGLLKNFFKKNVWKLPTSS
jgi:hypothetical protein